MHMLIGTSQSCRLRGWFRVGVVLRSAALHGLCLCALLPGRAWAQPAEPDESLLLDRVAAYVNDQAITVSDVMGAMAGQREEIMNRYKGDELREKLSQAFDEARETLITAKLALAEFESEKGQIPEWAIDNHIEEIVRDSFGGNRADLRKALRADGLTMDAWRKSLRERMILSNMRSVKVTSNIRVSNAQVHDAYLANRDAYARPARAHIQLLVLAGGDEETALRRARELANGVTSGDDFGALAREHSKGPNADKGGDCGWVELASLRPELAALVRDTAAGAVGGPIAAAGQVFLVRVVEKEASTVQPFEAVEADIERQLREAEGKRLYDEWVKSMRRHSYVKVVDIDLF